MMMINGNRHHGLTADMASERLRLEGPNELPQAGRRSAFRVAIEVLRDLSSPRALVVRDGARTEIGRIGESLARLDTEVPRLRRETTLIVTWCAASR